MPIHARNKAQVKAKPEPPMEGTIPGRLGLVCVAHSTGYPRLAVEVCGGRGLAFRVGDLSQIEASSYGSRSDRNLRRLSRRVDSTHFSAPTDHGNLGIDPAENGHFQ